MVTSAGSARLTSCELHCGSSKLSAEDTSNLFWLVPTHILLLICPLSVQDKDADTNHPSKIRDLHSVQKRLSCRTWDCKKTWDPWCISGFGSHPNEEYPSNWCLLRWELRNIIIKNPNSSDVTRHIFSSLSMDHDNDGRKDRGHIFSRS